MRRTVIAMVSVLLLFGTACAKAVSSGPGAATTTPTTIVLDPPMNTETFVLAPEAQANLTSSEAMDAFVALNPGFTLLVADANDIQLGYYTAAVGDGTYRFKDQLTWGYSWHQCPVYAHEVPSDSKGACTFWLFVDANTGEMLESLWQQGT